MLLTFRPGFPFIPTWERFSSPPTSLVTISSAPPPPPDGGGGSPSPAAARAVVAPSGPPQAPYGGASPLSGQVSRIRDKGPEEFADRKAFEKAGLPVLTGVGPGFRNASDLLKALFNAGFVRTVDGAYVLPNPLWIKTFGAPIAPFLTLSRILDAKERERKIDEVVVETYIRGAWTIDLLLCGMPSNDPGPFFVIRKRDANWRPNEAPFTPDRNLLDKMMGHAEAAGRLATTIKSFQKPLLVKFIVDPGDRNSGPELFLIKVKEGTHLTPVKTWLEKWLAENRVNFPGHLGDFLELAITIAGNDMSQVPPDRAEDGLCSRLSLLLVELLSHGAIIEDDRTEELRRYIRRILADHDSQVMARLEIKLGEERA